MLYRIAYPNVYRLYPYPNFELIAEVLETHFEALFDLALLETYASSASDTDAFRDSSGYPQLLDSVMKYRSITLKTKSSRDSLGNTIYTWEKLDAPGLAISEFSTINGILEVFYQNFQSDAPELRCLLLKPAGASPQLGLLEKILTNTIDIPEPLTHVDMLRSIKYLPSLRIEHRKQTELRYSVVNLYSLSFLNRDRLLYENDALIINFNTKKGPTKWGYFYKKYTFYTLAGPTHHPDTVFTEMPLTEEEKETLLTSLDIKAPLFVTKQTTNLCSTGYAALAELAGSNGRPYADFAHALKRTLLMQCEAKRTFKKDPLYVYSFIKKDLMLCIPFFQHYLEHEPHFIPGKILPRIVEEAELGFFRGMYFTPGHIQPVLRALSAESHLSLAAYSQGYISYSDAFHTAIEVITLKPPGTKMCVERYQENKKTQQIEEGAFRFSLLSTDDRGEKATLCFPALYQDNYAYRLPNNTYTITPALVIDAITNHHFDDATFPQMEAIIYRNWPWEDTGLDGKPVGEWGRIAAMMFLCFIRSNAKRRQLTIDFPPELKLSQQVIHLAIGLLSTNPMITDFSVTTNDSLRFIKARLQPILARNQWLQTSGYRIPFIDDYWRQAVQRWLLYLSGRLVIAAPLAEKQFLTLVEGMGLSGLNAVLAYLNDSSGRAFISTHYGDKHYAFYAASPLEEVPDYMEHFITHIETKSYFPFSSIRILYHSSYASVHRLLLERLITALNQTAPLENIQFLCSLDNPSELLEFFQSLLKNAAKEKWTIPIIIPELEANKHIGERFRPHIQCYYQLNALINHYRQRVLTDKQIDQIEIAYPLRKISIISPTPFTVESETLLPTTIAWIDTTAISYPLPLTRSGGHQLQMQQQQHLQQVRQVQQQQALQKESQPSQEPILSEVVKYNTIHTNSRILQAFQQTKIQISPDLLLPKEDPLQYLFRTWISANPNVTSPFIIHAFTEEAAIQLLTHHTSFISGLSLHHLPQGFYTQQANQKLTLCYRPDLDEVNTPSPFTIEVGQTPSVALPWPGGFYRVEEEKGTELQRMMFFGQLQPKADYHAEIEAFSNANPDWSPLMTRRQKDIIEHWPFVFQMWVQYGKAGIQQLLSMENWSLPWPTIASLLFKPLSPDLLTWLEDKTLVEDQWFLCAMGQVYNDFGERGLLLLLERFKSIDDNLGSVFFDIFVQTILQKEATYSAFIAMPDCIGAFDAMVSELSSNPAHLQLWKQVLTLHSRAVGWERIDKLWAAFDAFIQGVLHRGLTFTGSEFDNFRPANMLVCMGRIRWCIEHIPVDEEQDYFLKHLNEFDLREGGLLHALREGFRHIGEDREDLQLYDFIGNETYVPHLARLYTWPSSKIPRYFKRICASHSRFNRELYEAIHHTIPHLLDAHLQDRLILLVHTHYPTERIEAIFHLLESPITSLVAPHIHHAIYDQGYKKPFIDLHTLFTFLSGNASAVLLLKNCPWKTSPAQKIILDHMVPLFEGMSMLHACELPTPFESQYSFFQRYMEQIESVSNQYEKIPPTAATYLYALYRDIYKLATLVPLRNTNNISKLFNKILPQNPDSHQWEDPTGKYLAYEHGLQLLIRSLLFVSLSRENIERLRSVNLWTRLLSFLNNHPTELPSRAKDYIEELKANGIQFTLSEGNHYRQIDSVEELPILSPFVDHEERLAQFLMMHIAIPITEEPKVALGPIVDFLNVLQLNDAYINEIEPLLAAFSKTKDQHYWSSPYFYALLNALQPPGLNVSFPISLLEILLEESVIAAKPLPQVEDIFPEELHDALNQILCTSTLERTEQKQLCRLAVRVFKEEKTSSFLSSLLTALDRYTMPALRQAILQFLLNATSLATTYQYFKDLHRLFQVGEQTMPENIAPLWQQTMFYWVNACIEGNPKKILNTVNTILTLPPSRQPVILFILGGTLSEKIHDKKAFITLWERKSTKIIQALCLMPETDLKALCSCYPLTPSPHLDTLRRLIKRKKSGHDWSDCLAELKRDPARLAIPDQAVVTLQREMDLQRMLRETQLSEGTTRRPLSANEMINITCIFFLLKQIERDVLPLYNDKTRSRLDPEEIVPAFETLSAAANQNKADLLSQARLWGLLFLTLEKKTRKPPHLAQQFAIIANEICITSCSSLLQLATGEGKSHFIALRAARQASYQRIVTICTADEMLAERDQKDYKAFFNALGLTSAYIHPKSTREDYDKSNIRVSTLGNLNLFEVEQANLGRPVSQTKPQALLLDECDHVLFYDHTQFNYARSTGRTPKQMAWFYKGVNKFYKTAIESGKLDLCLSAPITNQSILDDFYHFLNKEARNSKWRQRILYGLLQHQLRNLLPWLQSAHEAANLRLGIDFTVATQHVHIAGEGLPMRIIVPLNASNQRAEGSTFSAGVHQLLVAQLNQEARERGEPQNYYAPNESMIISSQIADEQVWAKSYSAIEGYTGTISAGQADALYEEHGTTVLHVPTNQQDLRHFQAPQILENNESRDQVLNKIIDCYLKDKKSLLIACQHDRQVDELKTRLKAILDQDNVIFYTNDNANTPQSTLDEKRKKEEWQGLKKTAGVVVFASCFARGVNTEVDGVVVLGFSDNNQFLQMAGRTARNGLFGEVYRLYIDTDFEPSTATTLRSLSENKALEQQLSQLMAEHEYQQRLATEESHQYKRAIARYSTWAMDLVGQLVDTPTRDQASARIAAQLDLFSKEWLQLSSQNTLSLEEKVTAIKRIIIKEAQDLATHMSISLTSDFTLPHQASIKVVYPTLIELSSKQHYLASICAAAARLAAASTVTLDTLSTTLTPLIKYSEDDLMLIDETMGTFSTFEQLSTFLKSSRLSNPDDNPRCALIQRLALHYEISGHETIIFNAVETPNDAETKQRYRFLTQWETLGSYLPKNKAGSFLLHFCYTMQAVEEDRLFYLIKLTEDWWCRDKDRYQNVLLLMWQGLAAHHTTLASTWLTSMDYYLAQEGKSTFEAFSIQLRLLDEQEIVHGAQMRNIWAWMSSLKKRERTTLFADCIDGLQQFYHLDTAPTCVARLKSLENWPRLQGLLLFINKYHNCISKEPLVLPFVFDYFCDEELPLNRAKQLSEFLLTVAEEKPDRLQSIYTEIERLKTALITLQTPRFDLFIEIIHYYKTDIYACPSLLSAFCDYSEDTAIEPSCFRLLSEALVKAIRNTTIMPFSFNYILKGVNRFKHHEEPGLQLLNTRLEMHPAHTLELLFDRSINYLLGQEPATQTSMLEAIHAFYDQAKQHHGDINTLWQHTYTPWFKALDEHRLHRARWMHLLYQEALITSEDILRHDYNWTPEKNTTCLTRGFNTYVQLITTVLADKTNVIHDRDLSVSQQLALLKLTDEMRFIGQPQPKATDQNIDGLQPALFQLVGEYRHRWFKANSRKNQLETLDQLLRGQFQSGECRYQTVLQAILDAKKSAMEEDARLDRTRCLKMNRGGKSRYFSTLTKMEDLLVQHWVGNQTAVHDFQVYQQQYEGQLLDMIRTFSSRFTPYWQHTSAAKKEALGALQQGLMAFQDNTTTLTASHLARFLPHLEKAILPGYLKTVANEILARGESMNLYLTYVNAGPEIPRQRK